MSKAADMAKISVKGGFNFLVGLVISTVISAIGTIFVASLLAPSEYGIYTIALAAPNLISNFRDWGVTSAMIRYIAQYNAEKKVAYIKNILVSGLLFEVTLGLGLSFLSLFLSDFLALNVFQRPGIAPLIQIASFIILTSALLSTAQAAFTGLEKMAFNSVTLIIQSVIKTILIPILVIIGLSAFGAVLGYIISFLISGVIGVLLVWILYKNFPKLTFGRLEIMMNIKIMLKYGFPLSIGAILSGFLTQFYSILMAIYATDLLIGNYSVANNFVVLISFFSIPITTMLFPAFSKLDPKEDHETFKNVYQYSVKYSALLVVPVTFIVMSLAEPGVYTLFGNKYASTPLFLTLLVLSYLYSAFGNLSNGNLINSQGQTKLNLKLTLLTLAIGFPLGFALISQFNIIGLIITILTAQVPSLILSLYWIKKNYKVTIDWVSSAKILLSSAIAAALTYVIISQLFISNWIKLIIGITVFLCVLVPTILITKTIDRSDINNLKGMLAELGPIRRPINYLLDIIEKLMTALKL